MATAFTPVSANDVPLLTATNPGYFILGAFTIQSTVSIAVTGASARVALGAGAALNVRLVNNSQNIAFFKFGDSTVTATTADTPIMPGITELFTITSATTNVAAIGTNGTLYVTRGSGQ